MAQTIPLWGQKPPRLRGLRRAPVRQLCGHLLTISLQLLHATSRRIGAFWAGKNGEFSGKNGEPINKNADLTLKKWWFHMISTWKRIIYGDLIPSKWRIDQVKHAPETMV